MFILLFYYMDTNILTRNVIVDHHSSKKLEIKHDLYYGYTPSKSNESKSNLVILTYDVYYKSTSKSYREPYSSDSGYLGRLMYGKGWVNEQR